MKITKVTSRNIMFGTPECEGADVNMAVILGTKHNFVIDTGIGGDCSQAMLDYIGDDPKPIIVINTHHDWDHVAGNWVFEGSTIIAHKLCPALMDKKWGEQIKWAGENDRYFRGEARKCLPSLVFDGVLHFPEDGITIFHAPGHTEDSIGIYDAVDKVLHTGDGFGVYGGKAHYWGKTEDVAGFRNMIEIYKQYDFDVCISGHSEPQTDDVIALLEAALAEACEKQDV
ncbi:MAG: MBL fold metallo-hydrolase [Defluviitaleaceae bacterium]|nr:MBL fold metallo-hydrolase [Defluviitaleaceae bacterium]